jgi:hypothetical protein
MKSTDQKSQDQSFPLSKSDFKFSEHMGNSIWFSLLVASQQLLHHPHFIAYFPNVMPANSPHPPE